MISKKIFTALATTVALTVLPLWIDQSKATGTDLQENKSVQERITGTWRFLVTPNPGPAGNPPPSYGYFTFNREGTLIQSSSDSLEGIRTGHGVWKKTGKNELKIVFEKFIDFNPITQQPGIFVFRIEEMITLIGENNYEGLGQVSICSNAGQECRTVGTANTQASRLKITTK